MAARAAAQTGVNGYPSGLPAVQRHSAEPLGLALLGLPDAFPGHAGARRGVSMTAAASLAEWRARGGSAKVIEGGTDVAFMTSDGECRCELLDILFAAEAEVLPPGRKRPLSSGEARGAPR
jgi:hypothetical protein